MKKRFLLLILISLLISSCDANEGDNHFSNSGILKMIHEKDVDEKSFNIEEWYSVGFIDIYHDLPGDQRNKYGGGGLFIKRMLKSKYIGILLKSNLLVKNQ